jgi:hypothetical protein
MSLADEKLHKFAFLAENGKRIYEDVTGGWYWINNIGRRMFCKHGARPSKCKSGCDDKTGEFVFKSENDKDIFLLANGRHYWKNGNKIHYCRHGVTKHVCKEGCGGSAYCPCGKEKTRCIEHGGNDMCVCGKRKSRCVEHGGGSLCPCGKEKRMCRVHGDGSAYCACGKEKRGCVVHGGSSLCPCGKHKSQCRDHGLGSAFCPCGLHKNTCFIHTSSNTRFCDNGCGCMLSIARQRGSHICARCEGFIKNVERQEYVWLSKLQSWGFYPSVHDKIIKSDDCTVTNLRRADYMFATEETFPYQILVECDENSHGGALPSCEMVRLQEIHDQMIVHTRSLKPLIVIRFNPDSMDDIENDLRETLTFAFKGTIALGDARGVILHKLIGYGAKRVAMYEESHVTKRIKL